MGSKMYKFSKYRNEYTLSRNTCMYDWDKEGCIDDKQGSEGVKEQRE